MENNETSWTTQLAEAQAHVDAARETLRLQDAGIGSSSRKARTEAYESLEFWTNKTAYLTAAIERDAEVDVEGGTCPECDGDGFITTLDRDLGCERCGGDGEIAPSIDHRIERREDRALLMLVEIRDDLEASYRDDPTVTAEQFARLSGLSAAIDALTQAADPADLR